MQVQIVWQECPVRKQAQYFLRQWLLLQLHPPSFSNTCCRGTAGRSFSTSSVSVALWHGSHLQKELHNTRLAKHSQYLADQTAYIAIQPSKLREYQSLTRAASWSFRRLRSLGGVEIAPYILRHLDLRHLHRIPGGWSLGFLIGGVSLRGTVFSDKQLASVAEANLRAACFAAPADSGLRAVTM